MDQRLAAVTTLAQLPAALALPLLLKAAHDPEAQVRSLSDAREGLRSHQEGFVAGMRAIPADLYEAASLDGATRCQRLWHITLPALRPVILLLLILRLGDALG